MRRFVSIVRATALEILSEPLSLLVLLAALALAVFAPAFHYHQFGEATRMARDAGCSALFICGSVIAVFGTVRAFRREIESGTMAMALAHPVSRGGFFLSKVVGAFVAYLALALVVVNTAGIVFVGAAVGGALAQHSGDIARLYGPCLAGGVAILVLPLVIAAVLNRFARFRFVLSSYLLALAFSSAGLVVVAVASGGYVFRLLPVVLLIVMPAAVLLTASAAFAMRLKANAAVSAAALVFVLALPAVGNYYMADALSNGGTVPWGYVCLAMLAALPLIAAFLLLGVHFIKERDIQ